MYARELEIIHAIKCHAHSKYMCHAYSKRYFRKEKHYMQLDCVHWNHKVYSEKRHPMQQQQYRHKEAN
jgi:hypothetical protein